MILLRFEQTPCGASIKHVKVSLGIPEGTFYTEIACASSRGSCFPSRAHFPNSGCQLRLMRAPIATNLQQISLVVYNDDI